MRRIMVLNSKGGCGKSTLATNIAAYFASEWENLSVTLADFDPQQSSMDWMSLRPEARFPIHGLDCVKEGFTHLARNTDYLIIDAPARLHGSDLNSIIKMAQTVVIPVLPSTVDMKACTRFLEELRATHSVKNKLVKLGVVANRCRENYYIYEDLEIYLEKLRIPFLTTLRDAQNYVRAYTRGLGIHELPPYLAWPDWEQWEPLVKWLESKRSQP